MKAAASLPLTWIAAGAFALVLHGGIFAAIWMKAQTSDDVDALGAPAMEIGLDLAAPRDAAEDLPIGPVADAATAAVPTVAQQQKATPTDGPKEQSKETDDAERVVAPDVPKVTEEKPQDIIETKAVEAAASASSEAAAPPKIETAKEAPKSTAPSPGSGTSADLVRMAWQKKLVAHINRHKRYPATGTRKTVEVKVTFTLDRLGHVVAARVEEGSGDLAFDEAALVMMHKADPVPPPPPMLADEGLTFSLPVIFQNKKK